MCCPLSLSYASSIVVALGIQGIDNEDTSSAMFGIEWKSGTLHRFGDLTTRFALVGRVEGDSDFYIGAGSVGEWNFTQRQFIEFSLITGYYEAGDSGTELGGNLQFRTLLGYGYRLRENTFISIAVDHLSNSSFNRRNPGTEAFAIRFEQRF